MKTLTFPAGSLGATLYNDPAPGRVVPIAIPREFAAGKAALAADPDATHDRWIRAATAIGIVLVIATGIYFVI